MLQFAVAIVGTTVFLFQKEHFEAPLRVALALVVVWSVVAVGGLFDRRRWALPCELARLGVLWAGSAALAARYLAGGAFAAVVLAALVFAAASAAWLLRFRADLRAALPAAVPS